MIDADFDLEELASMDFGAAPESTHAEKGAVAEIEAAVAEVAAALDEPAPAPAEAEAMPSLDDLMGLGEESSAPAPAPVVEEVKVTEAVATESTEAEDAIASSASSAASERYEFDTEFQKKIVALMMRDSSFASMTDGLIQPQYFEDTALIAISVVLNKYFEGYRKAPGDKATMSLLLKNAVKSKVLTKDLAALAIPRLRELFGSDISDRDLVADEVARFARHQAISAAFVESVEHIDNRDYDKCQVLMAKAMSVGVQDTGGVYDYFETLDARTEERELLAAGKIKPTGITTGFSDLDKELFHAGWGRRELSVLLGPAKGGKSMSLVGFSVNAVAAGYNVLYITLEVAAKIIATRIDANISQTFMQGIEKSAAVVRAKVDLFRRKAGKLMLHEAPPGTMRKSDLVRIIERYRAQGIVFDLVVIDYADLMAPERLTDNSQENSKSVYIGLRAVAMEEGFAMLTATQTNRQGATKAVATATDVAEDFNKIRIADLVISLNATEEEKRDKTARLFFAASRNQRDGFTIQVETDIAKGTYIRNILGEI